MMRGRKVLVTGAGGFIGSHLVEASVGEGAEVTAFVRYTSRGDAGLLDMLPPDVRRSVRVVAGDLRDAETVRLASEGQQTVYHLGALIAIPYSYVHAADVMETNVMGTVRVLDAARATGVERVVHTSTSETYGSALRTPIDESHPSQAQSPYSASKIGADAIVHAYGASYGMEVATIRPFNTYGPRQSGRAVIPTIAGQALHSDAIRLGSLTPTRDFTFVTDTVRAFLAIGERPEAVGRVFNVGSGREISVGDLAELVCERAGRRVPIEPDEERVRPEGSEVDRLVSDATLAREVLGWEPTVSLDDGLDAVLEFLREHPGWTDLDRYEV